MSNAKARRPRVAARETTASDNAQPIAAALDGVTVAVMMVDQPMFSSRRPPPPAAGDGDWKEL